MPRLVKLTTVSERIVSPRHFANPKFCLQRCVHPKLGDQSVDTTCATANTLLSILVCVFETSATVLTFARSIRALHCAGGSLALRKHTLDYIIIEQSFLYFGYALTVNDQR